MFGFIRRFWHCPKQPSSAEQKLDQVIILLNNLTVIGNKLMVTQQDVLAQIATLSTGVDTLIAAAATTDLQPVADALTAIQTKVTAATAPVTPAA